MKKRKLFIGCSSECAKVISKDDIKIGLAEGISSIECCFFDETDWKDWASILANLKTFKNEFYYSMFIFFPDDLIESRGETFYITRDNVLFELGYFLGSLGEDRTSLMVPNLLNKPKDGDYVMKGMSDINGTMVSYYDIDLNNSSSHKDWKIDMVSAIKKINKKLLDNESIVASLKADKKLCEQRLKKNIAHIEVSLAIDDSTEELYINQFKKSLDNIIRLRSFFLNKPIDDIISDLLLFIKEFDDILDVGQLAVKQSDPAIREVWVYAGNPIEFAGGTGSKTSINKLRHTIAQKLISGCKYVYFINNESEPKVRDIIKNLLGFIKKEYSPNERSMTQIKSRIEFRQLHPKLFLTYFTLHFEDEMPSEPSEVFISTLHENRKQDVLIQVTDYHKTRIYGEIKNMIFQENIEEIKCISLF